MTFKLNILFLTTAAALFSGAVSANPVSYEHKSGATVVDINKADINGLSHNVWSEFNVGEKGMVLNNSLENILRSNGTIGKNTNLDKAASVILNEVVSRKASTLKGFLEVAGQKADVIVANPNGITCSGCSFINAGRATLTTGIPVFTDGLLSGFDVSSGNVTIEKNGLKNLNSYTDVMAQSLVVKGKVETGTFSAATGKYVYDIASETAKATASHSSTASIDIHSLGGIQADVIKLISTPAGVGVNNKGTLNANAIVISANGSLNNLGNITASDRVYASAKTLSNHTNANIESGRLVQLSSWGGDMNNLGSVKSDSTVLLSSGLVNNAAYTSASIINNGAIEAKEYAGAMATNEIALKGGKVSSEGAVSLTGTTVKNAAEINAGHISVSSAVFENAGMMKSGGELNIFGQNSITNTGTLQAQSIALQSNGRINNYSCSWWFFCGEGTMKATTLTVKSPQVGKVNDLGGRLEVQEVRVLRD